MPKDLKNSVYMGERSEPPTSGEPPNLRNKLTDEQIYKLVNTYTDGYGSNILSFARAIEAAVCEPPKEHWIQNMNRCTGPAVCTCPITGPHQTDNAHCPRNKSPNAADVYWKGFEDGLKHAADVAASGEPTKEFDMNGVIKEIIARLRKEDEALLRQAREALKSARGAISWHKGGPQIVIEVALAALDARLNKE